VSDVTIWTVGFGASAAVVVVAAVMFAWHSYLRTRLPLAVYWKELDTCIGELEGYREALAQKLKSLQEDLQRRWQEWTSLEAEIGEAKAWLQKNQEKVEQLPAMRTEIAGIEEKLRQGRAAIEQMEGATLQAKAQRLEEEEKVARARLALETARQETAELLTQRKRTEAGMESLQKQQRELQSRVGTLELDCRNVEAKLERLRAEAAREEKRLAAVREAALQAQTEQREANRGRDKAAAEWEALGTEIEAKKDVLKSLQSTVEGLSRRVDAFQQAIEPPPAEKRLADFVRPVLALSKTAKPLKAAKAERARMDACRDHIHNNGYKFHERALLAFHVSLKTADISPLVVLAGISGTGKSQLPRLYAEAMGMHFLNVAVQPRWDAPQDLFGFYNYMEHSYKATELARALRQMDGANWRADTDDEKAVQNSMLLVLLDEMNLARVEYYFSELLSKLEMRNATGLDEQHRHHLADIEIEIGPLKLQDRPRRLLVGSNVLFVGTMNEDETTQALSDKVIDRSNILRFGKPGDLKRDRPPRHQPPEHYLLHTDWQSWFTDSLPTDEKGAFDTTCGTLNTALSRVHKAFGHRVYQAMYRYVANYPRWVPNWFECAMADQLEQKIIPRLRGLSRDTDEKAAEVLDEIGRQIDGLHDDALMGAFREVRERPVFQWMGVNRERERE
jgi:uncharacterized coiled-coil DUF342 family protein